MQGLVIRPLGVIIRSTRRSAKVTQAQMAKSLGVSSAYISSLERDTTVPSNEFINNIVSYFERHHCDIDIFELKVAANMLRNKLTLSHLGSEQKSLVIQLATMQLNSKQRSELGALLKEIAYDRRNATRTNLVSRP